jgi:sugar lactone lactonase YvrE
MQLSRSLLVFSAASAAFLALAGCGSNYINSGTTGPTPYTGTTIYLLSGTTTSSSLVLAFPSGQANSPTATSSIILPSGSGTIGQYIALDPAANIYVATATDVREYAAGASGSAAPTRVLPLNATTTLSNTPTGIAADASGNIYVSEESAGAVAVFSAAANGSVAPTRFLSGALTTLVNPFQLHVDGAGNLYVMNFIAAGQVDILVFAPAANGNVAPIRTLNVGVLGFTVNSAGSVYAVTQSGVEVFAPGASGTPVPTQTITTSATGQAVLTGGIGVDSVGNIFLVTLGTLSGTTPGSPSVEQFSNISGTFELTNTFTPGAWSTATEPQDLIAVH